jgi:hypothetical protein
MGIPFRPQPDIPHRSSALRSNNDSLSPATTIPPEWFRQNPARVPTCFGAHGGASAARAQCPGVDRVRSRHGETDADWSEALSASLTRPEQVAASAQGRFVPPS